MKLTIFGAAGCAKEVEWLLSAINSSQNQKMEVNCFVDKSAHPDLFIGKPVLAEEDFFSNPSIDLTTAFVVAIAEPHIRYAISKKILNKLPNAVFPSFMHPQNSVDIRTNRFEHGFGNIFCYGAAVMPDSKIGNFLYQSIHSTIGHDCIIGDALSIFPGAKISGNVTIGNRVLIGAGATIKEKVQICDDVVIGAGAVVVKSIAEPGVYAGVPAKKIK